MLVEFIGAAGVGKTHLSEKLLVKLKNCGVNAENFDLIRIRRSNVTNWWMILCAAQLTISTEPAGIAAFRRNFGQLLRYSIRRKCCKDPTGIFITSEGIFHRIISFARRSRGSSMEQIADRLFRRIGPPDLVVVVEADAGQVFARRRSRNRSGDVFTRESVRQDTEMVKESVKIIERIRRELHPRMQVLRVDADSAKDDETVDAISIRISDALKIEQKAAG